MNLYAAYFAPNGRDPWGLDDDLDDDDDTIPPGCWKNRGPCSCPYCQKDRKEDREQGKSRTPSPSDALDGVPGNDFDTRPGIGAPSRPGSGGGSSGGGWRGWPWNWGGGGGKGGAGGQGGKPATGPGGSGGGPGGSPGTPVNTPKPTCPPEQSVGPAWPSGPQGLSPIATAISSGHAWSKHKKEFPEFSNSAEFGNLLDSIMSNPATPVKNLAEGRQAWWDESSGTVVIFDPNNHDLGTAFRPINGKAYFDNLQ